MTIDRFYSDEILDEILTAVAGGDTVHHFCSSNASRMPIPQTVYQWCLPHHRDYRPDFHQKMKEAEALRELVEHDLLRSWSTPGHIDATITTDKGLMPNSAEVQKYDMCLKHRQWLMSKTNPAKYSANPHRHIKLEGVTAAEKLGNLLGMVSTGELSVSAGAMFAQLIKQESEAGELKALGDAIKELSSVAHGLTNK